MTTKDDPRYPSPDCFEFLQVLSCTRGYNDCKEVPADLQRTLLEHHMWAREAAHKPDKSVVLRELFRARLDGHVDLTNLDLRAKDFRWANLANVDFSGSDLRGASFRGSCLYNVNLMGTRLAGVDFSNTHMSLIDFRSAWFGPVEVQSNSATAMIPPARFTKAIVCKSNFGGARLVPGERMDGGSIFRDCEKLLHPNFEDTHDVVSVSLRWTGMTDCLRTNYMFDNERRLNGDTMIILQVGSSVPQGCQRQCRISMGDYYETYYQFAHRVLGFDANNAVYTSTTEDVVKRQPILRAALILASLYDEECDRHGIPSGYPVSSPSLFDMLLQKYRERGIELAPTGQLTFNGCDAAAAAKAEWAKKNKADMERLGDS